MVLKHIAYFDESGDHGLTSIDPAFPVFVLCGCIYEIGEYLKLESPGFGAIKFSHFGHDAVVFHSREIRKQQGPFSFLKDPNKRTTFMNNISMFFGFSKATIVAAAINKAQHVAQYAYPDNPYEIALLFCLERLYGHLLGLGDEKNEVTCVFEERGKAEDATLASEFRKICAGANRWNRPFPFKMVFANKQQNMCGLQIADLAAYPIARHVINPAAPNPAYDAVYPRFRRSGSGKVMGWGLKIFP